MTSRSLLDTLDEYLSPIVLAQSYVSEDAAIKLRPLLATSGSGSSEDKITEHTWVNKQMQENLLHFAVHRNASNCVAVLINSPYLWNPDRPNLIGLTATNMAERQSYLPVWYTLLCKSTLEVSSTSIPRNVGAILAYPTLFLEKPLEFSEIVSDGLFGSSIRLYNRKGQTDLLRTMENLSLLFEMLLAKPELAKFPDPISLSTMFSRFPESISGHDTKCIDFPNCMSNFISSPIDLVNVWVTHRLQYSLLPAKHDYSQTDLSTTDGDSILWGPPKLSTWCRIVLRRYIIDNLSLRSYARIVFDLPIPRMLREFLSYRNLWPALDHTNVENRRLRISGNAFDVPIVDDNFAHVLDILD